MCVHKYVTAHEEEILVLLSIRLSRTKLNPRDEFHLQRSKPRDSLPSSFLYQKLALSQADNGPNSTYRMVDDTTELAITR